MQIEIDKIKGVTLETPIVAEFVDLDDPIEDSSITLDFQEWKKYNIDFALNSSFRTAYGYVSTPDRFFFPEFINSMKNGYALYFIFSRNGIVHECSEKFYGKNYGELENFVKQNPDIVIQWIEWNTDANLFKMRYAIV